jgi:hypothetical protein
MIVIPHFFGGIAILSFGTVLIVVAPTGEDFHLKIRNYFNARAEPRDCSQLGAAWRSAEIR